MTRQEVIEHLTDIKEWYTSDRDFSYYGDEYHGLSEEENNALDMAIEALQQEPIIRCEDCKHHGTSNCPMWGDDTTEDYMWCCEGERMESDEQ